MNMEVQTGSLLQLGDGVHEPVGRYFDGGLDIGERNTSIEKKRRNIQTILRAREQVPVSIQGLTPLDLTNTRRYVDGINGAFGEELASEPCVVREKKPSVRLELFEEIPCAVSRWRLSKQLRANPEEMKTGVERVLIERGKPSMFSVGHEQRL